MAANPDLKIEMIPVDELTEYENNARNHGDIDIQAIKDSIETFGFNDPIGIWSENNVIVEGHGRLAAARALGMTEVPCIRLDHMTDEERRAYGLAHNKTAELSEWNFAELNIELAGIKAIDMSKLGFEEIKIDDEYKKFEQKFEIKKTTDDCYTPQPVFAVVQQYVKDKYGIEKEQIVRPFYPGGDYQSEKYQTDSVIVDNPPFSIFAEIVDWCIENKKKFFLFAPSVTLLNYTNKATAIALMAVVEYENGAKVPTSFLTNLEEQEVIVRTDPELYTKITNASKEAAREKHKTIPRYEYPDYIVTAAMMGKWSKYGISQKFKRGSAVIVSQLDEQKQYDKAIYGRGLLLSERAAAERAAAERAAAERAAAERAAAKSWTLSEREMRLVATLK